MPKQSDPGVAGSFTGVHLAAFSDDQMAAVEPPSGSAVEPHR